MGEKAPISVAQVSAAAAAKAPTLAGQLPSSARLRMSGECRLLWAVLEDAIECYLRYVDHPSSAMRELFHEAKEWIEAKEGEELCSFSGICGAFQIDPGYLRRGLRRRLQEIREHHALVPLKRAA